jgi:tricorn protease
MNTASYQNFYSELFGSEFADKEGVVVDVRFNGGGNLANQLIADLSATAAGSSIDREGRFITHIPENRWSKPSILLANGYSYSDGSIFPHLYKQARLGAFVGEPVPGTGTSVWWVPMIGGKLKYGIPEIGRKDLQGRWFENTEDQPDILVRRSPDAIEEGRDEQLERAVEHLLGQLDGAAVKK